MDLLLDVADIWSTILDYLSMRVYIKCLLLTSKKVSRITKECIKKIDDIVNISMLDDSMKSLKHVKCIMINNISSRLSSKKLMMICQNYHCNSIKDLVWLISTNNHMETITINMLSTILFIINSSKIVIELCGTITGNEYPTIHAIFNKTMEEVLPFYSINTFQLRITTQDTLSSITSKYSIFLGIVTSINKNIEVIISNDILRPLHINKDKREYFDYFYNIIHMIFIHYRNNIKVTIESDDNFHSIIRAFSFIMDEMNTNLIVYPEVLKIHILNNDNVNLTNYTHNNIHVVTDNLYEMNKLNVLVIR